MSYGSGSFLLVLFVVALLGPPLFFLAVVPYFVVADIVGVNGYSDSAVCSSNIYAIVSSVFLYGSRFVSEVMYFVIRVYFSFLKV